MKKIVSTILFAITLFSNNVFSQSLQLLIAPKPSPYLSDWQTRSETARLVVNNTSGSPIDCKIKTQLYNGSGTLLGETDLSKMPILTIMPGIQQFNAEDIYPTSALKFYGASQTSIIQTGRIPDDNYRLCTNLMDPTTGVALNGLQPQCKMFSIVAYQAPVLIAPREDESISENNIRGLIFRWTPVTPTPNFMVTYKLQIWEVLEGQNKIAALRTNQPIIDKNYRGITQTTWPIDFAMPEVGKKYVWTITALDDQERNMVEGYGIAEPKGFSVNNQPQAKKMAIPIPSPPSNNNSVDSTPVFTNGTAAIGDTIRAGLNGEFQVLISQLTPESDGSLTGEGRVRIGWLKTYIAVEFKKVRVDSTKLLKTGAIISTQSLITDTAASAYPLAWGQSWLAGPWVTNKADGLMNWSNRKVKGVVNYINNNINLGQPPIPYDTIPTPAIPSSPLKMPFGVQFYGGADKLVITEFVFKPNESKINFLAMAEFAKSGTVYQLGFAGKYFKIHPSKIDFTNGRVELVEDITLPNVSSNPKMKFSFKKVTANAGCYIQWQNKGLTDISIGLEVKFTRDWFLPIPTSPDSVMATLTGNATNMHDILLTGTMPACELVGCNGLKLQQALVVNFDFSDVRNPSNMVFPANYPDSTDGVTWQGIYIKNFSMLMPDDWKSDPNSNAPTITASNIIIDDMGLTTNVKAYNLLTLQTGKVANLSASIDTVKISIISNSLVNGKVIGKLVLPLSNSTANNALLYTATFALANNANSFQMVIVPIQPISNDIMRGSMTLNPTSNITASKVPNILTLSIQLNGVFKWDNPNLAAPVINIINSPSTRALGIKGVKMEMAFQNLSLTYKNYAVPNVDSLKFNIGTWSFASPQKLLANFPVTIKNIHYKSLSTVPSTDPNIKELIRGAVVMDIIANLTDEIGGMTTIGVAFALERNSSTKKFTPQYKGIFIDSIEVHANLSAVKVNGSLVMYDNDPKFGDGFKATLAVTFTAVSLQINALAQFGNTTYLNNNQYYRYWRVEADVKLPVGIPFLTGVGFYGFGGGAFYNMKANSIASISNPGSTTYTFEPKKSMLGFVVKATVATMPKFETFNTDVSLMATFSSSGGIINIGFLGNFWLAAKLNERPASKIKGSVLVDYNFPDKIFFMAAGISINVPPSITTSATNPPGFVLNINGSTNKWYFKAGYPSNDPNTLNTVTIVGVSLYSYLMFGNDIPAPTGFTQKFKTNYFNATGSYPSAGGIGTGGVNDDSKKGKGIATGIGIEYDEELNYGGLQGPLCCKRNWALTGDILAGAELNLAFMEQTGCIGINGYRASGYLGLYASCELKAKGTPTKTSACGHSCSIETIDLIKIHAGAWCEGKFPNTEYLSGGLLVDIEALEGLIKAHYTKYFVLGTDCNGTVVNNTVNAAQEDKAGDLKNKLIHYVAPIMNYNFPVATTINAKFALVPNEVFDIAENQGDGTIKNRTFKLEIVKTLEEQSTNGSWVAKTVISKVNNIGEYQYYIAGTNTINLNNTVQLGSQLSANNITALNTNNGNTMLNMGNLLVTYIQFPLPPPPPPNYPNPVPNPTNHLTIDKNYKFKVVATLKELINGSWVTARTRNVSPVTETKSIVFRTGPMPIYSNSSVR